MERRLIEADAELARYLDWLTKPTGEVRRLVRGELWERRDGAWTTLRAFPDLREQRRDGRAPIVIDGDAMDTLVKAHRSKPSQGDIKDALKGLEPTPVEDPLTGELREDFANVPLKNADGTLTKYAKNLMDLHAPAARASDAASQTLGELHAKASGQ